MPDPADLTITRRDDAAGGSHLTDVRSRYFLRGDRTGGAFSLTEAVFRPGAQGTPMHVHTREEETYHVIEGALHVRVGDETLVLGPGDSALLPRNVRHKVTPSADQTTRTLMIATPPGIEGMLMKLDEARAGELDMDALLRLSADYGVTILPDE